MDVVADRLDIFLPVIGRDDDAIAPPRQLGVIFPRALFYFFYCLLLALLPMRAVRIGASDLQNSFVRKSAIAFVDASDRLRMRHRAPRPAEENRNTESILRSGFVKHERQTASGFAGGAPLFRALLRLHAERMRRIDAEDAHFL